MTARSIIVNHAQPRRSFPGRPRLASAYADLGLRDRTLVYDDPAVRNAGRLVRDAVVRGDPLVRATLALVAMPGAAGWLTALDRMAIRDGVKGSTAAPRTTGTVRTVPTGPVTPYRVSARLRVPASYERGGRP